MGPLVQSQYDSTSASLRPLVMDRAGKKNITVDSGLLGNSQMKERSSQANIA
jgi:hypothetical protein